MLTQKISQDQIQALKKHDQVKVTTLRYILAQIKNKEIEKKSSLTDDEVVSVLRKLVKELKESIESFKKGNRKDLVSEYQSQLDLISIYLPKEMSDDELKKEIDKLLQSNKEAYEKNPKAIIGICMKELRSKVDPSRIMKMLKSLKVL